MPQPQIIHTDLAALALELTTANVIVLDFETTSLDPQYGQIVGTGIFSPTTQRAFYINTGHMIADATYPRYTPEALAGVLNAFTANPCNRLIAHNATFDLRFLMKLGVQIRCRVQDTLIHSHRVDENLRARGRETTSHYHTHVSYGLKEMTVIYFNEQPPTLESITHGAALVTVSPHAVAQYCVLDCYNTWRHAERTRAIIDLDPRLRLLIDNIDDPNIPVVAGMMMEGVLIDNAEVARQIPRYETAIQKCREAIWNATGLLWPLDTPKQVLAVLRHLKLDEDLGYNAFWTPIYDNESDPSIARDVLLEVFNECDDPKKRLVIALFLSKSLMEQRMAAFLKPWAAQASADGRLRPRSFSSTLVTTRFSSSPNLQNLPGKADHFDPDDPDDEWRQVLPADCRESPSTKAIFIAKPGHKLVSMDLSAAEPRYLSLLFQRALIEREGPLNARRTQLEAMRWALYPLLMQRMHATRVPLQEWIEPDPIIWPHYTEDPLYRVFRHGQPFNDPYNALLAAMDADEYQKVVTSGNTEKWFKDNRWRGKKAFLALGYGSTAETLAPQLKWTVEKTAQAITSLQSTYATLNPLKELTLREMIHTGEVRTLWGRPRRVNGYYQLARPQPVTVEFYRLKPHPRTYQAQIIPLGTTRQGIQAFVERCCVVSDDGYSGEVILQADPLTGQLLHRSTSDQFVNAPHFNTLPFRNINYNQTNWVRDEHGLKRELPRQRRAQRQAFNALCQATGADHLRWLMNQINLLVLSREEFAGCRLILTVHDSLVFEVPDGAVESFINAALAVMQTPPPWCDIAMKVSVMVGSNYGDMDDWKASKPIGCLGRIARLFGWR